jgi:hypothetical protein
MAVEPTAEMRLPAMALHPSPRIEWLNDSLPDLALLLSQNERFDVIMLSAVWMHLDEAQRRRAMSNLADLTEAGGVVIMKIRHGPAPVGRRMFEISPEETIELARMQDLHAVLNVRTDSTQAGNRAAGVTWSNLAFVRAFK